VTIDDARAELLAKPLAEFTSERNLLARRLRAAGQSDLAADVARLRKPPVSLWIVNQLALRYTAELARLLDSGAALRQVQLQAGRGQTAAGRRLRESSAQEQAALDVLAERARTVLQEGGHGADEATLRRIRQTLHTAATSAGPEPEQLRRGILDRELGPAGFEGFGPQLAVVEEAEEDTSADRMREAAEAAEQEAQDRVGAAEAAAQRAAELRRQAQELEEQARDVARAAREAEQEARRLQREAEAAQRRARSAQPG
jgi:hypothetical protein